MGDWEKGYHFETKKHFFELLLSLVSFDLHVSLARTSSFSIPFLAGHQQGLHHPETSRLPQFPTLASDHAHWRVFSLFSKSYKSLCGKVDKWCNNDSKKFLAQSVKVLRFLIGTLFLWRNPKRINKTWGTFSVSVFRRRVRHFAWFLLNSLCQKLVTQS